VKVRDNNWRRTKQDVEVPAAEWLSDWNLLPAERPPGRPFCSIHWADDAERELLPADKVLKREEETPYQKSVIYSLERTGRIVARSEQLLWKIVPN
jgi:hypothetical protein